MENLLLTDPSVINYQMQIIAEASARRDLLYWAAEENKLQMFRAHKIPRYTMLIVYEHLHAHDPNCMYSQENLVGIRTVESAVQNGRRYKDFCLAESTTNATCGSESFISLLDLFDELEPADFDIETASQSTINMTIIRAYGDPQVWPKYKRLMEKNYTLEDFRPHYVRTFVNIGMSFEGRDISNYTKVLIEIENDVFNYEKDL